MCHLRWVKSIRNTQLTNRVHDECYLLEISWLNDFEIILVYELRHSIGKWLLLQWVNHIVFRLLKKIKSAQNSLIKKLNFFSKLPSYRKVFSLTETEHFLTATRGGTCTRKELTMSDGLLMLINDTNAIIPFIYSAVTKCSYLQYRMSQEMTWWRCR